MISRRDIFFLFVGCIVSAAIGLILVRPIGSGFDFAQLLYSVNTVSMVFATGLFSFLTAGLLFSSRASRFYLLNKIDEVGTKRAFLLRVLHTLAITSIFTIFFTIIVFLYPFIPLTLAYYPITLNHFAFFPAVLGAALVGSVLLALIASSLATFIDDSRLCVVLGCASTLLIAFLGGWHMEPSSFYYSLTRNIAFLSPHNIVRALAISLSGYQFESATRMVEYVGFTFSAESLTIAIMLLSSLSIVLIIMAQRVLIRNSARWKVLGGMIPSDELWSTPASGKNLQITARIRRGLKKQSGLTVIVLSILLVSMIAGVSLYTTYVGNSTLFFHHVSPNDEERLSVGGWNVYDVDVHPPFPGLFNRLSMFCSIESWGNASDSLSFYFGIIAMNSTDFNSLDEESRLALLSGYWLNETWIGGGGFGLNENLEESYGSYICVLRIIADVNPMENSYIEASLLIIQEGA